MEVLKMGYSHRENGTNCQDAIGIVEGKLKVVCDGCSEGKHSEVGANLFCQMFVSKYKDFLYMGKENIDVEILIHTVMDELIMIVGDLPDAIKDYLSFTILVVEKQDEPEEGYPKFYAYYCGDGYIVAVNKENRCVRFIKLDCGEYPEYLAYNYIDEKHLPIYKTGLRVKTMPIYDCDKVEDLVGVASDGIRFVVDLPQENSLLEEFKNIILENNSLKMKRFFNRNEKLFTDDFSIVI